MCSLAAQAGAGLYEAMDAQRTGEVASGSIAGRMLPALERALSG
jgi:hypothetical protein